MSIFRKISAYSDEFITTKEKHINVFDSFKNYAEWLTSTAGKARDGTSGKGHSYANYLIRYIILYNEKFNNNVLDFTSFVTLKEFEKLTKLEGFTEFNKKEGNFYSATLSCYTSYVTHLQKMQEEDEDNDLNRKINENPSIIRNLNYSQLIQSPKKREAKTKNSNGYTYPRDYLESLRAKENSNWQCEIDKNHVTFISNSSKNPYVEAHHLIPMAAQDYFDNTIDFADNIVCLCPNCHQKIHLAVNDEKRKIIELLFDERKYLYPKYGIDVELKEILRFYEIV